MTISQPSGGTLSKWLGLIRFSHTIFALPFALLATVMAFSAPLPSGSYDTHVYAQWIVLGTTGAVSAGLDVNIHR